MIDDVSDQEIQHGQLTINRDLCLILEVMRSKFEVDRPNILTGYVQKLADNLFDPKDGHMKVNFPAPHLEGVYSV